jgi:glutamyl-tRNA synthetase
MADSTVRVRFAPSPTGALHLGGARTALFNWLHARHTGGRFLLRIEDTDKERSTDESTRTILEALEYLGMDVDEEIVFQSSRIEEHRRALQKLIDEGRVYKCYCTPEERKQMREQALAAGRTTQYDGRCDGEPEQDGKPFVWRFRMPREGTTVVEDMVQGRVVTPNTELEDIVIARSDGSPLYNFVVVIDDAAMGITHVVRGKDHLTNTPKQVRIYEALGYPVPRFAHLPLILGLSKRLRSAGIESYRDDGYLPEAINNYIARLGWSHGDQEVFGAEELVELFDLADVNRSEGKLNMEKMTWLNQQHIQRAAPSRLAALTAPFLEEQGLRVDPEDPKLVSGCISRQKKARTLREMAEGVKFYFVADEALEYEEKSVDKQLGGENRGRMAAIADALEALGDWTEEALHEAVLAFCAARELKLKHVAQPCRVSLTGSQTGPGLFEMMAALGRESTLARLRRAAKLEA